ncbi:phosphate acetyltransferase [Actinorhabdospora filicis]|uniref:Phosphate acetyltransferase n=1 Tax=Actinorhabdospora filicis TaxID=1785913 RepID=A0A9W6SGP9_9ACTN|nr:phosphate acetyltransferase [Actinorhabdospora filicis]GLZ75542.1 phosphate acetyltransferase [Actinorhabdospora filicis]
MAKSLYLAALDAASGKSTVALGLTELLTRTAGSVGVFRPVIRGDERPDPLVELLRERFKLTQDYEESVGVTYDDVRADSEAAVGRVVERYHALAARHDAVLVIGTDYTDVASPTEFEFNLRVAVNLASPVLLVVTGDGRTPAEIAAAVRLGTAEAESAHATVCGVVVNRVAPAALADVRERAPGAWVMPETPALTAPTVGELAAACGAELIAGSRELLGREARGLLVGAMTLPNLLDHLVDGAVVMTPGDRTELLLGLLVAHHSVGVPAVGAIMLTGGIRPPLQIRRLLAGVDAALPILLTEADTFETATRLNAVKGTMTAGSDGKIATALGMFATSVDGATLLDRMRLAASPAVTPLMFEHRLVERARASRRRIVLPEGGEPRVIRAADIILRRGVADVTLLGDAAEVHRLAAQLGADLSAATVVSPFDPELRERFAHEYARLRAHKGVTPELALDVVTDVSYFGTMMVQEGLADGMVSGAAHTTAHTIRPAFEIIRTVPGTKVVSSVFFMCLADRVLVYGDCAVIPEPTAEQLADIAISSAHTAEAFGVEPRVAMLSYSTGASGAGSEVDKVREATALVRARVPGLPVEGPIQYDAAVDTGVASTKLPGSDVAGRATVFVVPDLNTGNNLYKAVQRSAGAVAVGPVLQGLRRPVNDLSRGATVHDIVNTVALTAVQAQMEAPL